MKGGLLQTAGCDCDPVRVDAIAAGCAGLERRTPVRLDAPDGLFQRALALSVCPDPPPVADAQLRRVAQFLRLRRAGEEDLLEAVCPDLCTAMDIFEAGEQEPLNLCVRAGALALEPVVSVAAHVGIAEATIAAYEALFWNVRDSLRGDGAHLQGMRAITQSRMYATPYCREQLLLMIALSVGWSQYVECAAGGPIPTEATEMLAGLLQAAETLKLCRAAAVETVTVKNAADILGRGSVRATARPPSDSEVERTALNAELQKLIDEVHLGTLNPRTTLPARELCELFPGEREAYRAAHPELRRPAALPPSSDGQAVDSPGAAQT